MWYKSSWGRFPRWLHYFRSRGSATRNHLFGGGSATRNHLFGGAAAAAVEGGGGGNFLGNWIWRQLERDDADNALLMIFFP